MEANRFNHILLQQYLNGELDKKGMHELEKQALDDPFLADALDGYAKTPVPVAKELSLLQAQLAERIADQQERKSILSFSWQRLSVAAAACLLFVLSTVLLLMKTNKDQEQLASQPKEVEASLTPPDSILKSDNDTLASTGQQPNAEINAIVDPESLDTGPKPNRNRVVRQAAIAGGNQSEQGEVFEASSARLAEANDTFPKKEAFLAKSDSDTLSNLAKARTDQARQVLQTPVSVQKLNNYSLSEVELKGFNAGKAKLLNASYYPKGGWAEFDRYLKTNLNLQSRRIKAGTVILNFTVSAEGKPSNITVEKGLNRASNREAIRVLRSGPEWEVAKDSTARVTIQFEK